MEAAAPIADGDGAAGIEAGALPGVMGRSGPYVPAGSAAPAAATTHSIAARDEARIHRDR
jgi:hypothetical protein